MDRFAAYLAEAFGCSRVLPLSSSDRDDALVVVDEESAERLADSILVGALEPHSSPLHGVVQTMRQGLEHAAAGLITAHAGTPFPNPSALKAFLSEQHFVVPFAGWTGQGRTELAAIVENNRAPQPGPAPASFRVLAFMPVFNEADVIGPSLRYLIAQGIDVYVLDNWSTDGTAEQAHRLLGRGVVGVERFPSSGPLATYEWRSILSRIEMLAARSDADWFVLHDADERRYPPWPGLNLKAGLHHADRSGFNCVDHVVVHRWPTRERFDPADTLESQLPRFTFSSHPGHFHQRRAWRNPHCEVSIASSAGHDVRFPGRLVYPFKFLLHHYPIRSQEHGERKVFGERAGRWNAEERSLGWHRQYDGLTPGQSFLREPAGAEDWDRATFDEKYLLERLSGIGVYDAPPAWATGPRERFDCAPVA